LWQVRVRGWRPEQVLARRSITLLLLLLAGLFNSNNTGDIVKRDGVILAEHSVRVRVACTCPMSIDMLRAPIGIEHPR
jgi:hypothetical protein